jgi:hypothetical protein
VIVLVSGRMEEHRHDGVQKETADEEPAAEPQRAVI